MIAERLKLLRKKRNITQRIVARGADIGERQYQFYESGERKPSYEALLSIANYLDVSVDYLMGRTDKQEVNRN